jgi:hypothetical protein
MTNSNSKGHFTAKIWLRSYESLCYFKVLDTLSIAEILSVKNERAWVSMVSYLKK